MIVGKIIDEEKDVIHSSRCEARSIASFAISSLVSLFLLLCCFGCSTSSQDDKREILQKWMQNDGKVKVLSSINMINDLVEQIGTPYIDTMVLIQGELDPHSYELVKGDDEKLARADIIFFNGLGLEHGPSLKKYFTESKHAIALGGEIQKENPLLILSDRGQTDPHIWMDVSLWQKNIPLIVKALQERDPEHAEFYAKRGEKLQEKFESVDLEIKEMMQSIPEEKRFLVTSHDAFNYFTRSYLAAPDETEFSEWKKRFVAPEGLAPEGQMSAKDIKDIISHMKKYHILVLFPESNVSKDSIKKILDAGRQEGLKFEIAEDSLYGDAMGPLGTEEGTYLGMILSNAKVILKNLKKEDTASSDRKKE